MESIPRNVERAQQRKKDFDWMRDRLERGNQNDAESKAEMKANILAQVEAEIDAQLKTVKDGQGLGIIFRLVVQNSDLTFRHEPKARQSPEMKEWRQEVFRRDNYTCRECGTKNNICAHHIEEWAKCSAKRFDTSNGITLCRICHAKKHPQYESFILNGYKKQRAKTI